MHKQSQSTQRKQAAYLIHRLKEEEDEEYDDDTKI